MASTINASKSLLQDTDEELSIIIVQAAIEVQQSLGGPGLLEAIYESALCHELAIKGIHTQRQLPIPVCYKGARIRDPLYLDILVENKIIVEVKATEKEYSWYPIQLYTHLRMSSLQEGLLINFGKEHCENSICRVLNTQQKPIYDAQWGKSIDLLRNSQRKP